MRLTDSNKQEITTKIRSSKTFRNAPTSNALLQYLLEATLKETPLKESIIEIDFFGSKEISDKNNPRVRVNVYNLRKKIANYYENEGKDEVWQLTIDKGQYHVRFIRKQSPTLLAKKINWSVAIPYIAFSITILALIITNTTPKPPSIWKSFLTNNIPTNLIIGDHFGATGKTITGGTGWTRDFELNNVNEFYNLLEEKPSLRHTLKPANYTYTTRMASLATQQFERFFQHYNKGFDIRFSTLTSISEIKEGNAIYAGPIKNGNQFPHFFNESNPYFKVSRNELTISNHPKIKDTIIHFNVGKVDEEYAIVSKYLGIDNTEHFVFFSEHDIGVSATAEYFTNKDSIQNFVNRYLNNEKYFTALFKVKGQHRTNTDMKLIMAVGF